MYRFSITALLLGIAPLLSTTPLSAQITLDTSNLSVPIGSTFTLESLTYQGPLAQAPIELGPAGANQTYEVTRPLGGPVRIELRSTVVRLSEAPDAAMYPEATYAAHYEIENPDGSTQDLYAYFGKGDMGDFLIAIDGPPGITPPVVEPTPVPMPMTYGSRWSGLESIINTEALPGIRSLGSLTLAGVVDGWGTITVPAGEFPYLRLHQTTTGDLRYEGDAEFEALGVLDLVTEAYSWNTHFLGTVVSVSQSTVTFRNGGAPPVVTTQIVRLLEASGIPSVVASIGWGQLKANHMNTLQMGR